MMTRFSRRVVVIGCFILWLSKKKLSLFVISCLEVGGLESLVLTFFFEYTNWSFH